MILKDYSKLCGKSATKLNFTSAKTYWRYALLEKCMRIFEWKNLPESIPQKEIEIRCILSGFAGWLTDKEKNNIVTFGSMSGVTNYADEFTIFTFATPRFSGVRRINNADKNKGVVIINNNSIRNPMFPLIERYSILLAHADISFQSILINTRASGILAAKNQQQADSLKMWYEKLVDGSTMAVVDENDMNSLLNAEGLRQVSTAYPSSTSILDYYTAIQNLLKSFYNDIGVRMSTEKRERLISDEVNSDNQMLLFNLNDMLKCRQDACKRINKIFSMNISVEFSEEFKQMIQSADVAAAQQEMREDESE